MVTPERPPYDCQRDQANGSKRTRRTVAPDRSALLQVLDALTAADVSGRIRQAVPTIY